MIHDKQTRKTERRGRTIIVRRSLQLLHVRYQCEFTLIHRYTHFSIANHRKTKKFIYPTHLLIAPTIRKENYVM